MKKSDILDENVARQVPVLKFIKNMFTAPSTWYFTLFRKGRTFYSIITRYPVESWGNAKRVFSLSLFQLIIAFGTLVIFLILFFTFFGVKN